MSGQLRPPYVSHLPAWVYESTAYAALTPGERWTLHALAWRTDCPKSDGRNGTIGPVHLVVGCSRSALYRMYLSLRRAGLLVKTGPGRFEIPATRPLGCPENPESGTQKIPPAGKKNPESGTKNPARGIFNNKEAISSQINPKAAAARARQRELEFSGEPDPPVSPGAAALLAIGTPSAEAVRLAAAHPDLVMPSIEYARRQDPDCMWRYVRRVIETGGPTKNGNPNAYRTTASAAERGEYAERLPLGLREL